jgi:outer membrane protein assembly factor BamB
MFLSPRKLQPHGRKQAFTSHNLSIRTMKKYPFPFVVLCTFLTGLLQTVLLADKGNWPSWRPVSGTGSAEGATPPLEWGDDKNIKWKVAVPGAGFSTPIVWGDTIYLLTAVPVESEAENLDQRRALPPNGNSDAARGPGGRQPGQAGPAGQRGPGGPGGFDRDAIIKEFDKDGDGELNETERDAMRTEMQSRRGGPGRGGPGGEVAGPGGRPQRGAGGGQRGGGNGPDANLKVHQFKVVAVDRNTGKIRWEKVAREERPHEGHHPSHGYADASPITDGEHLFVSFGSRGIYCFDMDGNLIWETDLGDMRTRVGFGEGASPALAGDKLIILWDTEDESYIAALDKGTGEEVWRTERDERTSWTTPFVLEVSGKLQIIVAGSNATRTYDAESGDLIWQASGLTSNVIPVPVVGHGNVYVASGYQGNAIQAIQLDSQGDVSGSSKIVWRVRESAPYVASPVLSGKRLYATKSTDAYISCLNALTGEYYYQDQKLDDLRGIYASPLAANGYLYVVGREGTTVVLKDSETFEIVATNKLDDKIDASPVAIGGELFLRGHQYLYCISKGG